MSDIAIRVENLGKRYRIGERERYKALRDVITDAAAAPFRKLRTAMSGNGRGSSPTVREGAVGSNGANGNGHPGAGAKIPPGALLAGSADVPSASLPIDPPDTFWALQDVSFEVKRGEVVGIIGRNGAGKSTLLKILSRITAPTTGEVEIKGRVGSLLEVGTGFHPELTGRENIYLNGAILGMKRAEIKRKFDEMVAFAEIEKFIDTPVKRYSSGMYVRLAFAVAAHLDPEILLVDEVLAVGDAQFQKKCLGKMGDVAKEGRTVLFVSHNMGAIEKICGRCLLLGNASLLADGKSKEITDLYLGCAASSARREFSPNPRSAFTFTSASANKHSGESGNWFDEGEDIYLKCVFEVSQILKGVEVGVQCYSNDGPEVLFASAISDSHHDGPTTINPGSYSATLKIGGDKLFPGVYTFSFFSHIPYLVWFEERAQAVRLTVKPNGTTDARKYARDKSGYFKIGGEWRVTETCRSVPAARDSVLSIA